MTNGTVALQSLWDAVMFVFEQDACIAAHAVIVINTQTLTGSTYITKWTVIGRFARGVIVEVANVARVSGKGLVSRAAVRIGTLITGRL